MNEQTLRQLAHTIEPDADFVNALEAQLKQRHRTQQETPSTSANFRWIAASISIVGLGLLLLLPPTQTFAVQMFQFFFPTTDNTVQYDESNRVNYPETVEVQTIAEAETIAGFDIYEWTDDTFQLQWIYAGDGAVTLIYEKIGSRGNVLHFNQTRLGLVPPSPFDAVPAEVPIQQVTVAGFTGEYVEGYWVNTGEPDDGEFEWVDAYFHHLRWVDDDFQFRLMMNPELANSAEDAVTIAGSLVQRD